MATSNAVINNIHGANMYRNMDFVQTEPLPSKSITMNGDETSEEHIERTVETNLKHRRSRHDSDKPRVPAVDSLGETKDSDNKQSIVCSNVLESKIKHTSNNLKGTVTERSIWMSNKSHLSYLTEHVGTKLIRAFFLKRVNESRPKTEDSDKWTVDIFLNKNFETIRSSKYYKQAMSVIFPVEGGETNLDRWDLSLLLKVLKTTCKLSRKMEMRLSSLKKIRNKLAHFGDANIDDTKYKIYLERIGITYDDVLDEINDEELSKNIREMLQKADAGEIPDDKLEESLKAIHRHWEELSNTVKSEHKETRLMVEKGNRELMDNLTSLKDLLSDLKVNGFNQHQIEVKLINKNITTEMDQHLSHVMVDMFSEEIKKITGSYDTPDEQKMREAVHTFYRSLKEKGYEIVKAEEGCILLHIQLSSFTSVLSFYMDYINGSLDIYLLELQKEAGNFLNFQEFLFEMNLYEEDFLEVIANIRDYVERTRIPRTGTHQHEGQQCIPEKELYETDGGRTSVLLTVNPLQRFRKIDFERILDSESKVLINAFNPFDAVKINILEDGAATDSAFDTNEKEPKPTGNTVLTETSGQQDESFKDSNNRDSDVDRGSYGMHEKYDVASNRKFQEMFRNTQRSGTPQYPELLKLVELVGWLAERFKSLKSTIIIHMDEVQERCVLLQNLPPSCTVANITAMLDQTHGNIRFLNKYEKIDRHMDSERWIVLFRTKNDAEECIKSGEWECSVLGETCLVKPECCPQSFIPDEWLQNTSSENDIMERLTEDSGDDLKEGTLRAEDELKSFVAKKKTDKEDDTTTEANFNMQREVGNVSLHELFGSEKGKKDMKSTNFSYNKDIGNSDIEDDILKHRYAQILDDSVENPELFGSDHGYVKMSVTSAEMYSSENDVKTGTDHQDKTKYDKQNFDGSIPLNQRQKNTVPEPQTISAENQHNKTFIGSDKIADSCSSRYSDALPIQGIHVITSSSESSSASQRQTLNVPQTQSYSQFPMVGDFGHAAYPGVHPSMHQNILPYFIPNENYRLPYPPFYTMQQMQQFPVFYPMPYPIGSSGLQYHGTLPGQWFYVPAQPGNNDYQGNTYDIPINREMGTINEHESEKHIYHEIDDIQDTRNDEDEAHNTERASSRIEEPNKSEKWHTDTRNSGRALPPLPGSRTSDSSTGSRTSDSSSGIWSSDSSARSRTSDISTGSRTSDCSPGSLTSDNSTAAKKRSSSDSNPPLRNSGESDRKEVNDDIEEIGERMKGENKRILVKGLSDVITKDDLESYFKARQIGGGDIVFSEIDGKKRHAIIEYKSEIDAREVIKRASRERTYNLKGCNLEVFEYVPPTMDPLKLFIQGIDDITTDECIVSFTEEICKLPSKVKRGETPGTAMLCFDVAPDLEHIQKTCETRKCDGCNWQISPVEQTRSVQISFLNSQISKDALLSYFENEQLSDGGPVESVIFRADRKDWIVTFMRAEDAERTQRKGKHDVDGQTIEVQLHYPCLELDEEYIVKIPDPLLFDAIDEHICKFLQSSPKYRSMIENGVSSQHGRVIWDANTEEGDTCIQIVCIVDPRDRDGKKKVRYWTENCRLEVTDVVDTLTVKRTQNVAVEEWSHVKSRIGEISVADPQYVAIAFADSECVVVVSGEEQHVIEAYNQIKLILGEVEDKLNSENPVITMKLRFEMYELELVRQSKLEDKFRKKLEGFYIDEERSEFTFKGKQKAVDHALTKLRSKLQSFVSTSVPGFTSEAKRLMVKSRAYISAKIKQEKIMCVWNVPKNSDVVLYGTDEKDVDRAAQILQNLIKVDSIQLDQSKANFIHSAEGEAKLRFLKENNTTTFSCSLLQYELRFACFAQIYDEVKSTIADLLNSQNVVSHFIPTDIGICSFIIQYKRAELNNIEKRYRVGLEPVGIEQIQGFTVKGDDGCRLRLAIIELLKVIDSVVHIDLKLAWPGLDKYLKSREGLEEMKQIELNEKCVFKVLFEESTLPKGSQKQNDNAEVGSDPHKHQESDMQPSKINKRVVLGTLAAEKTDVIVNSTNFNLDMNVGGISRSLLKAGGDQLGIECKTKYPDGIKVGEIAVTSGGSLNCKHLFHGVLIKWDGAQGHAERVMIHFIKACLEHAHTYELESISFPALGTGNLVFPAEVVAQIMNDVVDEFGTDNPNTSLKLVNFVIRHEDTEIAKAFECYSVNRRSIRKTREEFSRRYTTMGAEKIILQGGNLHTTVDNVSIIVEQGDITKTPVGAIVNSTVEDLNLNSGAISKAILRAAGSSIQKEASSKKDIFDSKGLVVTRQGRLTMCQKILHIRARNGHKGWTESIQQCLTEIENLGLNSVAFPALGTGGKGVPAEQMAKTMIEAFQDFIKSPKYKGSLRTIHIVIFDRKMLETFVAVIKTALDPQQKKGFFHFLERKSLYANTTLYTTVHIYAGCSQYIDSAISKIEAIRRDEAVAICSSVRITCNDCYAKDLQKIAHRHGVQVIVGKGEVKVIGYGKAADAAITEVDKYLKDLETHIEKNKELSTSNT